MKSKHLGLIFSGGLCLYLVVLLWTALGYPMKAKLFPLIIIPSSLVLLGIQIFMDMTRRRRPKQVQETDRDEETSKSHSRGHADATMWIVGSLFGFLLLGHILIFFLLPLAYSKLHKERWSTSIILSLSCGVSVYILFVSVLDMRLFEGFLYLLFVH